CPLGPTGTQAAGGGAPMTFWKGVASATINASTTKQRAPNARQARPRCSGTVETLTRVPDNHLDLRYHVLRFRIGVRSANGGVVAAMMSDCMLGNYCLSTTSRECLDRQARYGHPYHGALVRQLP